MTVSEHVESILFGKPDLVHQAAAVVIHVDVIKLSRIDEPLHDGFNDQVNEDQGFARVGPCINDRRLPLKHNTTQNQLLLHHLFFQLKQAPPQ
ncbi:hypothetical protein D3C78_1805450 [compost metagenome]